LVFLFFFSSFLLFSFLFLSSSSSPFLSHPVSSSFLFLLIFLFLSLLADEGMMVRWAPWLLPWWSLGQREKWVDAVAVMNITVSRGDGFDDGSVGWA
jgi:hypothetical protein